MCTRCKLLVPLGHGCKRCKRHPGVRDSVSGAPARVEPALADDPVEDKVWEEVVRHALPVLRTLPLGCQDPFFTQLGLELDLIDRRVGDTQVYRLATFCRIVLQPVGRGGRRHCRQVVAVVNGRIARWAAGQYGSLVREYLVLALDQRSRGRTLPEDGGDTIPAPVRRAALRAVRDGALSKAARILSQQSFPLPEDVQSALQNLHPAASEPFVPPPDVHVCDDFTVEEVADALRGFAPGTAGGFSGLMPQHLRCQRPTATYLRLLQQIARLCSDFA